MERASDQAPKKLVVFDLDGTLTSSVGVDDDCFVRAVREVYGLDRFETDWARYPDATDAGLSEDVPRAGGREPGAGELAAFRARFCGLIETTLARDSGLCAPIGGVQDMLRRLCAHGWSAAIATGSWKPTALAKLRAGGLEKLTRELGIGLTTSDDARRRVDIVRTAIARAPGAGYDRIVCVGDGVWDVRAARDLGLPFVGMGDDDQALRAAGAGVVLSDYLDDPVGAFESAPVPGAADAEPAAA